MMEMLLHGNDAVNTVIIYSNPKSDLYQVGFKLRRSCHAKCCKSSVQTSCVIEFVCSMSVKEMCRVLFPYEAANEDELTLKEGDLITLLSREVADQGWWRGELRGKVGVFPDNFVEVVQQEEVNE